MTATTLKAEIHKAVDLTDDEAILEAIYTILNKTHVEYSLTANDWKLVENRKKQFESGELSSVSIKDIRKKALSRIKK